MKKNNKVFAPSDVRKEILRAMTPQQRESLKHENIFAVQIVRHGKELIRWGANKNTAEIKITGKCCRIHKNNLVDFAWNYDEEKAEKEAAKALSYFVYGDNSEYEIIIQESYFFEDDIEPSDYPLNVYGPHPDDYVFELDGDFDGDLFASLCKKANEPIDQWKKK